MAERRMFAKTIIDSDAFLDMPATSQLLYFHLAMRADDDGFVNSPKKVLRVVGCAEDDLKLLFAKKFLIPFDSGVVVIKHWKIHNYIQKDRYKPTVYKDEKAQLILKENGSYRLPENNEIPIISQMDTECIQSVYSLDTQDRVRDRDRVIDRDNYNVGYEPIEVRIYREHFGKEPTVAEKSLLSLLLNTHSIDLVEYAFMQAVEKDKKNIAYVQTTNLRAKVHNICVITKEVYEKGDSTGYRSE